MAVLNELPELVISSRTQSEETIKKILKAQGYDNVEVEEQSDATGGVPSDEDEAEVEVDEPTEPVVETPVVETPKTPDPVVPPVVETPAPPAETQKTKEPGSKRYKRERDQARADLEASRTAQAKFAEELEEIKKTLAKAGTTETPKPTVVEQPKQAPPKPVLILPKLDDPGIDGDWDKLQAATTNVTVEHAEKISDWKDEVRELKRSEERAATKRIEDESRSAEETAQNEFVKKWDKNVIEKGKSKYTDFMEVAGKTHDKPIINVAMQLALLDLDNGSDLVYWLSTHPDEANALVKATILPDKNGKITATPAEWESAVKKATYQFGRISASIVDKVPEPEDEDEDDEETPAVTPVAVAPPVPVTPPTPPTATTVVATPAGQPAGVPVPKVKPKPTPADTVGGRGGAGYRRLNQLSEAEIRNMSPDDYRKRKDAGETV